MAGESGGPSGGEGARCLPRDARLDLAFDLDFGLALALDLVLALGLTRLVAGVALTGLGVAAAAVSAAAADWLVAIPALKTSASTPREVLGFDERLDLGPNFKS
ncbi:MAG: hypothetical protein ACOY0T_41190 [Myxococcota bacterium]